MSNPSTSASAVPPGSASGRRRLLALLGLGVAGALGACGKKGPPRLPEPPDTGSADEETE